ncbi:hypothetical protein [Mesorhizobium sp. B2-1-2]|uniref:hypothetical protein n=1 Tax=Mesorhizobium sp. B2-1-2 TaxID=2589973 RepID=UPI001127AD78|nr:hypothetical protein [Mesorhizobium sp. B2-1-2]TPN11730.1 hypothetical protein FJ971_10010 [Mesorhizobium sp. B2-1-2]
MREGLFLGIVLGFLATANQAVAGPDDAEWNPPERFDHLYKGKLTIKYLPQARVQVVCERFKYNDDTLMRGCSSWDSTSCIIVVVDKTFLGQTPAAVIRHEMGHCNGWPADHSG